MATEERIAIRTELALKQIEESARNLAGAFDVDAPDVPRRHRDKGILKAMQLEAIGDWLQELADNAPTPPKTPRKRKAKANG